MSGLLLLARHGESEWNALGKWTGITDVHLTSNGFTQAAEMGSKISDIALSYAYCSEQIRTLETLEHMLNAARQPKVDYERTSAVNERDYGIYTGLNKHEVQAKVGDEVFQKIRRSWDYPIPNGETLEAVYARTIPFLKHKVLPRIARGENVLVVAHGNSLRSIIKYIESINDHDVESLEFDFGHVKCYRLDDAGKMLSKSERY